jgi:signal transduction histidine kinase
MANGSFPYESKLRRLVEFSTLLNSSFDIFVVLRHALSCVEQLLEAEVVHIYELHPDKGELGFLLGREHGVDSSKGPRLRVGEGVSGWVALTGKPLLIADFAGEERFRAFFRPETQPRTLLCVPVKSTERFLGVIEARDRKDGGCFNQTHLEILILVGNLLGTAVENTSLFNRLKKKLSQTQAELGSAQERLRQAERLAALGKLSQGVAHEVRNPVMVIGGFAHRLQKKMAADDSGQEMVGAILKEASQLEVMVREIEALAALPEPRLKPDNLSEVLETVLEAKAALLPPEIHLQRSLPTERAEVLLDRELITLALQLLIDNAAEAMPRGGDLLVQLTLEAKWARLTVSDSGVGIAAEQMPYLFDPFFSTYPDRIGIGLTKVHRIVSDHQGEIKISSEPGQGTKVQIILPRYRPRPKQR